MKSTRTEKLRRSFSRSGVQIWNSLSRTQKVLIKAESKSELKKALLKIFETEDDYIEVSQIKQWSLS